MEESIVEVEQVKADFWKGLWVNGNTPWDTGGVSSALKAMVEENSIDFQRAIVPGCGSGYDVFYLASKTQGKAIGLDLSPIAVDQANTTAKALGLEGRALFIVQDFFKFDPSSLPPIDFVYDHTFFCAIDPSLRMHWGKKMSRLIHPGGYLVTYMFPINSHSGGPPYAVQPEHYEAVLREFFDMIMIRDIKLEEKFVKRLDGPHGEKIALWRRNGSKI